MPDGEIRVGMKRTLVFAMLLATGAVLLAGTAPVRDPAE